ncbi:ABC transporter ATP-binding protein [Clavibacter nebraskensis]|uniref:ABC transporter consisting of fused permease and ATPase domains n=2 Tax=Clavibacter nebraskensis TaxID=31963 RepID=A0AAI9EJU6_9MICO|nr:ABC transporter ATP-binding protein [Clavibacter nebraskensis]KXU21330.1 ABC transporter [Clavibacter nebraskensis]OAH20138.1 ABC transporter [Clavibacter nebraskensis]QGV66081.1 ABC transporter ATP-binding protein [Clavibacter nebraskensis]QGV68880.1 ABC transporter ATP-binding protein [Clavibacter nebraskensis]QGV71670.1 ABC transporter ATP-binding protein [Clavibacter nebraskensis]
MGDIAAGGGMRGGGGRRGRVSAADAEAQRKANAEAPRVENLLGRIAELFRPHRRALVLTIALVLVGAGLTVVPPLLTQQAFDRGLFPPTGGPDIPVLVELVGIMIAIWVAGAGLGVWQTYLTATVGNRVMGSMRVDLFRHLQGMELGFFTRTKTGVIQSRLQNDVGGVAAVLTNTVSSVLGNTVTVIAALVAMLVLNWQLTLVAVVLMPVLVIAQRRVGQVRARIASKTQESLSDMTAITQETLSVSGILLSKSFNRQAAETARYEAENRTQIRLQVSQQMSGQWFFALVQIFLSIIPAIVYVVAGFLITGGVSVTAGTIVAFTTVQARLMWPLIGLMRVALDLQTSGALFARIFEYLDLEPAIRDRHDARQVVRGPALGRVAFDDVRFSYPDTRAGDRPTLDGMSFAIEPGQFAAFVGPSGAGKTTVSYLIPRFHDVTGGRVLFSGEDVRDLEQESLLENIGIVSQETYLFHATIGENLRYACPDATQEQIEQAARAANIHPTIESFPDGYDTLVGERGYRLSGGEKQRIAIARVLLKDPAVLILDEATSALDAISERVVQQALDTASRGRTTIAIAHRLSTVVDADVIFVVVAGRIVEQGTHVELLARRGEYARLYSDQRTEAA